VVRRVTNDIVIGWASGVATMVGERDDAGTQRYTSESHDEFLAKLQAGNELRPWLCLDHRIRSEDALIGEVVMLRRVGNWIRFRAVIFDSRNGRRVVETYAGRRLSVSTWSGDWTFRDLENIREISRVGYVFEVSLLEPPMVPKYSLAYANVMAGAPSAEMLRVPEPEARKPATGPLNDFIRNRNRPTGRSRRTVYC
jgi:hypothetical protein